MPLITIGVWQNLKNGTHYLVTGMRLDCTNNKSHLTPNETYMVDYEDQMGSKYTRSYEEFIEKFISVCTI